MYTDFQSSKRVYVMLGMFVPSTYTYKNDVRYREKKGISLSLSIYIYIYIYIKSNSNTLWFNFQTYIYNFEIQWDRYIVWLSLASRRLYNILYFL